MNELHTAPTLRINLVTADTPSGVALAHATGVRFTYSHPAHHGKVFHAHGLLDLVAQTWPGGDAALRRDAIIERFLSLSDKLLVDLFLGRKSLCKLLRDEFKIVVYTE